MLLQGASVHSRAARCFSAKWALAGCSVAWCFSGCPTVYLDSLHPWANSLDGFHRPKGCLFRGLEACSFDAFVRLPSGARCTPFADSAGLKKCASKSGVSGPRESYFFTVLCGKVLVSQLNLINTLLFSEGQGFPTKC